ncbi:MAG: WD40 repeat protein [Crocinitomix sp.]
MGTILYAQSGTVKPVFQTGHYAKVNQLIFHSNNIEMVTCGDDGKLIIWDIVLGLQRHSILANSAGIRTFKFLTDSSIVSLSNNSEIQLWNYPELTSIPSKIVTDFQIRDLAVINDSTLCVVGRSVHMYHIHSQKIETLDFVSKQLFTTVAYHPGRNEIAIAGPIDNYCTSISLEKPFTFQRYLIGNINKVSYLDSNQLMLASIDGSLIKAKLDPLKKNTFTLKDNHNFVTDMDLANGHIAAASTNGFAVIMNAENQRIITKIGLNGVALTTLDYSADNKWLAIANEKGTICLYETENYKLNRVLKGASASITAIQLYGKYLFVGYSDGIIRQLDLAENKIVSNSIKLDPFEEQQGINYAILSIDTLINNKLQFTVLKTDRHHDKRSLIRSVKKIKSVWDLDKNILFLQQEVEDLTLRLAVDQRYKKEIPFQIEHYSTVIERYSKKGTNYQLHAESLNFSKSKYGKTITYPQMHEAPITGLRFSENGQLVVSYSRDGSIRFWDDKGNYLAALYLSGQYGFTYWNPDNYYFSSKETLDKIGFIYKNKLYSFEQFDVFYNRPSIVMKNLPFFSERDVTDFEKAYNKRLEKLGITTSKLEIAEDIPEIDITYLGEYSTKSAIANFTLNMSDPTHNLTSFTYRINGIEFTLPIEASTKKHTIKQELELASGINQIEFFCTNSEGVKSLIKKQIITCEKVFEKPELYIVSIGVSNYQDKKQNLKYARKDAEEIAALMETNKQFNVVHQKTILDSAFTKNSLVDLTNFLTTARINDVVVFYFAGHGVLDAQLDYYLGTYDMNFNAPSEKGLAFNTLEELFEQFECRNKLMLIDACFSGELDKTTVSRDTSTASEEKGDIQFRSSTNALLDGGGEMGIFELSKLTFIDLTTNRGTNILSSASGIEYAIEGEKWQNGLFTHVLKKALLDKQADLNGDKLIRIMELQVYLRETVSSMSGGAQNPILRKENNKNNFIIW